MSTTYPSSTRGDIQTPGVGRISRPRVGFFTSTALEGVNKQWIWKVLTSLLFCTFGIRLASYHDIQVIGMKI